MCVYTMSRFTREPFEKKYLGFIGEYHAANLLIAIILTSRHVAPTQHAVSWCSPGVDIRGDGVVPAWSRGLSQVLGEAASEGSSGH